MVALFLADGCEEIEALTVIDVLRRADINIKSVSIKKSSENNPLLVHGAHSIDFMADLLIDDIDIESFEMIVLPGGMPGTLNLKKCTKLISFIKSFDEQKKYLAAICAAPTILGGLGLLKEKEAVSYPSMELKLYAKNIPDKETVVSDNIITSRGMGCAIDFALNLVEILKGKEKAKTLAKEIVHNVYS